VFWGVLGFDMVVVGTQSSIGKYVIPIQNMHTKTIDNAKATLIVSQGDTLGNRQDAVVRKMNVEVQELELAA
jgi:hypothetical protein